MKKVILLVTIILVFISLSGCTLEPTRDENIHPTKEEWLEIYMTHKIEDFTDMWGLRTSTNITIINEPKEVIILITQSNREDVPNEKIKQDYINMAKSIAENIMKDYDWVSNYKLVVQFL